MHHWLEEDHPCLKSVKRRLRKLDKSGWMPVEKPQDSASLPAISGPYESLFPITDDLFEFFTGNPGDRGDHIFGYVDLYGNTTATPSQLATMEKWLSGVIEYDVEPISVTGIVPYAATLTDVQQAEALLAELMKDDILPLFERRRRYIGNPDNYTKYFRTYGFYYISTSTSTPAK